MTVEDYYNQFENLSELVSQANVDILDHAELLEKEKLKNPLITDEAVRQKYAAMVFIMGADARRYGDMVICGRILATAYCSAKTNTPQI